MTLLRGVADDLPLMVWLQQHHLASGSGGDRPGIRHRRHHLLAIAEMLRGGTTCANENYFFPDAQAAVYKKYGFRAWSARR